MSGKLEYRLRPDDSESKEAKIKFWENRLHWKLPITMRYAFTFGITFGLVSIFRKRKIQRFLGHVAFWTPTFGLGLCYHEFYELFKAKQL
mmetsp:Transcript_50027/g.57587  ORF Transcript_50027/g.57587 Transcript_50027/m.57587 type:complete len:90 (+) Transcript_50027:30-299(+)